MKWSREVGPMGVSRSQVVLEWLKQPGNCERYMQAGCEKKRRGNVSETKNEVAGLVCTLLQNAGFPGVTPKSVIVKFTSVIKNYKRAHALAVSGASEAQVKNACPEYYDLVEPIGAVIASNSTTNKSNRVQQQAARAPRRTSRSRSHVRKPTSQAARQVAQSRPSSLPPSQHQEQQARRDRIEEIQAHAILIQQMRETGFSKDEITAHLQLLLRQ